MKKNLLFILVLSIFLSFQLKAQNIFINEDFQTGSMPVDWTQSTLATDGGWKFGTNTDLQSTYFAIPAHTTFACTNDDACNCNKSADRLVTDTMDLSSVTSVILKFDYYFLANSERATVEVSNDNGVTWIPVDTLSASGANWTMQVVNISSVASGHSQVLVSFFYNDLNTWGYGLAIDNVRIQQPSPQDAELARISPGAYSNPSFKAVGDSVELGGTLFNNGADTLQVCTVNWSDGFSTYTDTLYPALAAGAAVDFVHSHKYIVATTGAHPLQMWVEQLNDTSHANDTLGTVITGAAFMPSHKVTIEDITICSSGYGFWSPRGIVYIDSLRQSPFRSMTEVISVHTPGFAVPYDPMADTAYATAYAPFILAWPEIHIDRKQISDPHEIFTQFNLHSTDFGIADVAVNLAYDTTTRNLDVNTDIHFAVNMNPSSGHYKLALVLTEDSVHGPDPGYSQRNAYANGANGPMACSTMDFSAQPDPVPASLMYYTNVAREIIGTYNGMNGSLPDTVTENGIYNYAFPTYTIPVAFQPQNMRAIVLLIDSLTGEIKNSNSALVLPPIPVGIQEASSVTSSFNVFPNPFTEEATLILNLNKSETVSVCVTDILGVTHSEYNAGILSAGQHALQINGKYLANGVYFITMKAGETNLTRKVLIQK